MPDIQMCEGTNCPLAFNCYRATATPNPFRQPYYVGVPWDEEKKACEYYLPNEKLKIEHE